MSSKTIETKLTRGVQQYLNKQKKIDIKQIEQRKKNGENLEYRKLPHHRGTSLSSWGKNKNKNIAYKGIIKAVVYVG